MCCTAHARSLVCIKRFAIALLTRAAELAGRGMGILSNLVPLDCSRSSTWLTWWADQPGRGASTLPSRRGSLCKPTPCSIDKLIGLLLPHRAPALPFTLVQGCNHTHELTRQADLLMFMPNSCIGISTQPTLLCTSLYQRRPGLTMVQDVQRVASWALVVTFPEQQGPPAQENVHMTPRRPCACRWS